MKKKKVCSSVGAIFLLFLFIFPLLGTMGFCAVVDRDEAVAVADLWYSTEINSGHVKITDEKKTERLDKIPEHKVLYMVSDSELLDTYPGNGKIPAYVVKYSPTGYAVVSGEDRIEPVIAFDEKSEFRWDHPGLNFMRHFLGKEMPKRNRSPGHQIYDNLQSCKCLPVP